MLDCGKGLTSRFDASCLAASLLALRTRLAAMPAATRSKRLYQLAELAHAICGQDECWPIGLLCIKECGCGSW
jgi:hypothetical protein